MEEADYYCGNDIDKLDLEKRYVDDISSAFGPYG
jgi:hypothetical protein